MWRTSVWPRLSSMIVYRWSWEVAPCSTRKSISESTMVRVCYRRKVIRILACLNCPFDTVSIPPLRSTRAREQEARRRAVSDMGEEKLITRWKVLARGWFLRREYQEGIDFLVPLVSFSPKFADWRFIFYYFIFCIHIILFSDTNTPKHLAVSRKRRIFEARKI